MKHRYEMNIVLEWDETEYPYMLRSLTFGSSDDKISTGEVLWGLHGGDLFPICTKFDTKHTTEGA